jgi:hypothetical protein
MAGDTDENMLVMRTVLESVAGQFPASAALPHPQPEGPHWANLPDGVDPEDYEDAPPPPSDAAQGDKEFAEHMDTLEYVERVFRDEGSSRMAESVARAARFFASLRAHKGEGNG